MEKTAQFLLFNRIK